MVTVSGMHAEKSRLSHLICVFVSTCVCLTMAVPSARIGPQPLSREIMREAAELGNTDYKLMAWSHVGCPEQIQHGMVTERDGDEAAVEGIIQFDQIHMEGEVCPYSNADHELRLYSYQQLHDSRDEIGKVFTFSFEASRTISMAGLDFAERNCGTVSSSFMTAYYFVKDIGLVLEELTTNEILTELSIPGNQLDGERNWMLSFPQIDRDPLRVCLFLENRALISPSPSPSATPSASASLLPTTTPGIDGLDDDEPEDDDDLDSGVDGIGLDGDDTTFGQANNEMLTDSPDPDDDGACFPADALVRLRSGDRRRMADLRVGDEVQVDAHHYSRVFLFTHRERAGARAFVQVCTADGRCVALSEGHFVPLSDGRMLAARHVRRGHELVDEHGVMTRVVAVNLVSRRGLFNPQTAHGAIVVDGLCMSTYTEMIPPRVAHPLLAPLRALFASCGATTRLLEKGAPRFLRPLLG